MNGHAVLRLLSSLVFHSLIALIEIWAPVSRKRTREVCLASQGANPAVAQRAQTHGGQEKGRQKTMNKLCCCDFWARLLFGHRQSVP